MYRILFAVLSHRKGRWGGGGVGYMLSSVKRQGKVCKECPGQDLQSKFQDKKKLKKALQGYKDNP